MEKFEGPLLLYSGTYDSDSIQPFVTNSNFFYLTDCDLPNIIVLVHNNRIYVFTQFENKQFFDNESAIKHLLRVFKGCVLLKHGDLQSKVKELGIKKVLTLPNYKESPSLKSLKDISFDHGTLETSCHSLRLIKTPREIQMITKACQITSKAVKFLKTKLKPSMKPYEVIALFDLYQNC